MSGLRQFQRRAIEALAAEPEALPPPEGIGDNLIWTPEGTQLVPLGISRGVGTCSGVHGVDVLVVAQAPRSETNGPTKAEAMAAKLATSECAYTVEVRGAKPHEREQYLPVVAVRAVELLRPASETEDGFIFERTGKVSSYVNLV